MAEVALPESSHTALSRRQQLLGTFEGYRATLDADNERRERLIILSRNTTQLSKKLIFHLHRGATSSPGQRAKNIKEARGKEKEIWSNFVKIRDEIKAGERGGFWKWDRQVAPGLEEYIEAASFLHYLEQGELITLDEIQANLSDPGTKDPLIMITGEDYILGMSDLTGELMRYATNALSTGDHETPLSVCSFVRTVKSHFDSIPLHSLSTYMAKKLSSKQEETTRSLIKIEKVCYSLRLRLIEYADRPDILAQMAKRALEDANDGGERREE